jgi:hypothetical protein
MKIHSQDQSYYADRPAIHHRGMFSLKGEFIVKIPM